MRNSQCSGDLTTPEMWDGFWRRSDCNSRWKLLFNGYGVAAIHQRQINKTLELILSDLDSTSGDVIELGCAPGRLLEHMARLRPQHRYHGLDYAEDGVKRAKVSLRNAGLHCTIHQGDIKTFEPPRKYDLVVSCGLIEHFTNPLPILKAHKRFCAPNGRVAITVPNYANPITKWFIQQLDPKALETHVLETMNERVIGQLFQQAGFERVRIGSCGGPRLRTACEKPTFSRSMLRTVARAWNVMAYALPPSLLWNATIWGIGEVPNEAPEFPAGQNAD